MGINKIKEVKVKNEIREILSERLAKEEKEKVEKEFTSEGAFRQFIGAAEMLVFERKNPEEIPNRLVEFITDPDAGMGDDPASRLIAAEFLKTMESILCATGSNTFYHAWQHLKKAFAKIANPE